MSMLEKIAGIYNNTFMTNYVGHRKNIVFFALVVVLTSTLNTTRPWHREDIVCVVGLPRAVYKYLYTRLWACLHATIIIIIIIAEMAVFNVAGYLIEERRRWPVITASPRGQHSK